MWGLNVAHAFSTGLIYPHRKIITSQGAKNSKLLQWFVTLQTTTVNDKIHGIFVAPKFQGGKEAIRKKKKNLKDSFWGMMMRKRLRNTGPEWPNIFRNRVGKLRYLFFLFVFPSLN